MTIQRYDTYDGKDGDIMIPSDSGEFVLYDDHVEAVAEARSVGIIKGHENAIEDADRNFEAGRKAERIRIQKALEELQDEDCRCYECVSVRNALATIDGEDA